MNLCSICEEPAIIFDIIGDQTIHLCEKHATYHKDSIEDEDGCMFCFVESSGLLPKCIHK